MHIFRLIGSFFLVRSGTLYELSFHLKQISFIADLQKVPLLVYLRKIHSLNSRTGNKQMFTVSSNIAIQSLH